MLLEPLGWPPEIDVLENLSNQGVPQRPMHVPVNLEIGGQWPEPPDETTPRPSYFDAESVRIYAGE
jgi:hypothetical protein